MWNKFYKNRCTLSIKLLLSITVKLFKLHVNPDFNCFFIFLSIVFQTRIFFGGEGGGVGGWDVSTFEVVRIFQLLII